jgi:hypothetical protein
MLKLIWWIVIGLFRSRASLEAEMVTLRHQLNVLPRKSPKRLAFSNFDRLVFATLYRAVTSRLLDRPVSVAVKGPSAGGKSFVVESTLKFARGELLTHGRWHTPASR